MKSTLTTHLVVPMDFSRRLVERIERNDEGLKLVWTAEPWECK